MKVKKYYLSKSENTRRGEKLEEVKQIVITSSKYNGFTGLKNRNIIEMSKYREDREFSCHYIIGISGEIINIIPEKEKAICTRDEKIDRNSISIMLSVNKEGTYSQKQYQALRELVYNLIEKYNLTKDCIYTEYDINCSRRPILLVDEPIILEDILNRKIPRIRL